MTIDDIAGALGVSKTTVSRAISGNGRVSPETRRRVLEYMQEHDFHPNVIAQNLAAGRSSNIAFIVPGREALADTPYFLRCLLGAEAKAAEFSNEIILLPSELDRVKRVAERRKADGAILSRSVDNDAVMEYLIDRQLPFVLIGSTDRDGVTQVDGDHRAAARILTKIMLEKHDLKAALLNGERTHTVNRTRAEGFLDSAPDADIAWDALSNIGEALDSLLEKGNRLLLAADDVICSLLAHECDRRGVTDIKIASFFSSDSLKMFRPDIPAVEFDSELQGAEACSLLLRKLDGETTPRITLLDYKIYLGNETETACETCE
ncbi:MAG: LacI family transcriptional regulator [Clostridiales bacterium]|nr:LacI family transcriptional regulator [Clostridiales bacterium]